MGRYKIDPKIRFENKINKTESCWEWLGAKIPKGYGYFHDGIKNVGAHRYSYSLYKGSVGSFHVCHSCDNPGCVNPEHLWLGTNNDNRQDSVSKNRLPKGKDHWNYQSGVFTKSLLLRDDKV